MYVSLTRNGQHRNVKINYISFVLSTIWWDIHLFKYNPHAHVRDSVWTGLVVSTFCPTIAVCETVKVKLRNIPTRYMHHAWIPKLRSSQFWNPK